MSMDELNQKLNEWANSVVDFFKNLPETIKNLPHDEQLSYGAITLGFVLVITGGVLWIV